MANSAPVMALSMVTTTSFPKCNRIKPLESFSFLWNNHAFWRRNFVSNVIIAIGVSHVFLPEIIHFYFLQGCDTRRNRFGVLSGVTFWKVFNWINCTAMENKIRELCYVRGILVIYSVLASIGSPIRSIPYSGIQWHWFRREITTHRLCPLYLSNGNIVNIKSAIKHVKINLNLP